VLDKVVKQIN